MQEVITESRLNNTHTVILQLFYTKNRNNKTHIQKSVFHAPSSFQKHQHRTHQG